MMSSPSDFIDLPCTGRRLHKRLPFFFEADKIFYYDERYHDDGTVDSITFHELTVSDADFEEDKKQMHKSEMDWIWSDNIEEIDEMILWSDAWDVFNGGREKKRRKTRPTYPL